MCGIKRHFSGPFWDKFLFFQTGPYWYFQLAKAKQYLFEKAAKMPHLPKNGVEFHQKFIGVIRYSLTLVNNTFCHHTTFAFDATHVYGKAT